jgi:hypothetical protein
VSGDPRERTARRREWLAGLAVVVAVALGLRLVYVALLGDFVGGDEAVGALMALAIRDGRSYPLFVWDAHYAGTLVSWIGALVFAVAEPTPGTFRLGGLPLGLAAVAALYAAGARPWGIASGVVAGLTLAAGPPLVLAATAQAMGGYAEAVVLGAGLLWLGPRLAEPDAAARPTQWFLLGASGGFGAYSQPLVLPLFAVTLVVLARRLPARAWAWVATGFVAGALPLVVHNVLNRGATVLRLGARVLGVSRAEVGEAPSLLPLAGRAASRYLARVADAPEALARSLPAALGATWPLAPVAWVAAATIAWRARRAAAAPGDRTAWSLGVWGIVATLGFAALAGLDQPRHLVLLALPLGLVLGGLWGRLRGAPRVALAAALAAWIGLSTAQSLAQARDATPRVAALAEALERRGLRHVYTDYFLAYPLVFVSRAAVLASPAAGPVNVDRMPGVSAAVDAAPRVAYVFVRDTEPSRVFVREMRRRGHGFAAETLGGFDVYVPERPVRPGELDLVQRFR